MTLSFDTIKPIQELRNCWHYAQMLWSVGKQIHILDVSASGRKPECIGHNSDGLQYIHLLPGHLMVPCLHHNILLVHGQGILLQPDGNHYFSPFGGRLEKYLLVS